MKFLLYFIYLLPICVMGILFFILYEKIHFIDKMNDTVKVILSLLSYVFALCTLFVPFWALDGDYNTYCLLIIPCGFSMFFLSENNLF